MSKHSLTVHSEDAPSGPRRWTATTVLGGKGQGEGSMFIVFHTAAMDFPVGHADATTLALGSPRQIGVLECSDLREICGQRTWPEIAE